MAVSRDTILDTALMLAESRHWEAIRLHDVAEQLQCGLDDIRAHYPDKEALVDAWLDRADEAMLADAAQPDYTALTVRARLQRSVFAWLGAFGDRRRTLGEMIAVRLEPGHLHIQIPSLIRLSRTVQWLREAAHRDAVFVRRALEETVLTGIFVTTAIRWLNDDSPDQAAARELLERLLSMADQAGNRLFPSDAGANENT